MEKFSDLVHQFVQAQRSLSPEQRRAQADDYRQRMAPDRLVDAFNDLPVAHRATLLARGFRPEVLEADARYIEKTVNDVFDASEKLAVDRALKAAGEAARGSARPEPTRPSTWGKISGLLSMSEPTAKKRLQGAWRKFGSKIIVDLSKVDSDIRELLLPLKDAQKGAKRAKTTEIRPEKSPRGDGPALNRRHEDVVTRAAD